MTTLDLSGQWKLRPEFLDVGPELFSQVAGRPNGPFDMKTGPVMRYPLRQGFLSAQVPGDVITPLVETGLLHEPLSGTGTKDCLWIKDYSWWFMREFEVSRQMMTHECVFLTIGMLDYKADIIINGMPAGQHKNAFRPYEKDIKSLLKPGRNQIIIRLTCGLEDHYPLNSVSHYFGNGILEQKIFLRKPIFGLGWDWCKPVPTCGIGRGIQLKGISGARMAAWRAETTRLESDGSACIMFHLELDNLSTTSADDALLTYDVYSHDTCVLSGSRGLYLPGGKSFVKEDIVIKDAQLWWPNGYGDPYQYEVSFSLTCRRQTNSLIREPFGIRTIHIDQSKRSDGTRNFRFVVNGVPVFCKGGNWVPADSVYLRIPESKYKALVDEASHQHFNMLRMWGGGTYEPDAFYEQCSRRGILIMHDFMYACAYYPDQLDWFRHEALLEADYQTKRLAKHACMAVWTGNNEIHESYDDWFSPEVRPDKLPGAEIFNYIQPDIVQKNCPEIPYMPSSPFFGDRANSLTAGDTHAWTFMGRDPETRLKFTYELEAFDRFADQVRFSSEFGFHGALMKSSVERYHEGQPLDFDSEVWLHHGEHERKTKRIRMAIDHHLTDADKLDPDGYLLYSGLIQGALYEELALALRRQAHCSGNLIWMYNDCWPETGWTTVDYYLTRKIAFYFLKRAFHPQKLILRVFEQQAQITVINETAEPAEIHCEFGYMTFSGEKSETQIMTLKLNPHDFQLIKPVPAESDLKKGVYYLIRLPNEKGSDDAFAAATSLRAYYRDYAYAPFKYKLISRTITDKGQRLEIEAETFIPLLQIRCVDDRVHLSDNYFPLLPGERKTVTIEQDQQMPDIIAVPVSMR